MFMKDNLYNIKNSVSIVTKGNQLGLTNKSEVREDQTLQTCILESVTSSRLKFIFNKFGQKLLLKSSNLITYCPRGQNFVFNEQKIFVWDPYKRQQI